MTQIELIGGPLDGARAQNTGELSEGDHITVEPDEFPRAVYTFHDGFLEYDARRSHGPNDS